MKLKKLIIHNFRCYKDRQELEFDLDGKITLIYGLSGHGKSTLLQFLKWMFYDIYPGKKESKFSNVEKHSNSPADPLYNKVFFEECESGKKFSVFGSIEFEHAGVSYQLIKETFFEKSFISSFELNKDLKLNYQHDNGSWVKYPGDINEKILEIVPKALSKYFFFSGEENVIEEANSELKSAIYNLFGLSKYENALRHLGNRQISGSVVHKYEKEKLNNKPKDATESASKYLDDLTKYTSTYNNAKKYLDFYEKKSKEVGLKIEEYLGELAVLKKGNDYKNRLKDINDIIDMLEKDIQTEKGKIGNSLYLSTPYLILTNQIKLTRDILAKSAKEEKTYKDLTRSTLLDIIHQKECVCGRCIDEKATKHIQSIIDSMPPHSYNYTYNQFVKDVENHEKEAEDSFDNITNILIEISSKKEKINEKNKEAQKIIENMKSSPEDQIKLIGNKLDKARADKVEIDTYKDDYSHKCKNFYRGMEVSRKKYEEALKYEGTKLEIEIKLEILKKTKEIIEKRLESLKEKTSIDLNKSIIEVYNQISTRVEEFEDKKFLDDDFTLRKEYKTGGQDVVDVFAYIIGMIKAIQTVAEKEEGSEFPVVIDAPFSHTDHLQMAHVIDVISNVVPQTTMFTLDIIRIRESCDLNKFGKIWFIESDETQKVSKIVKGEL